jgi:hypothetical protein
MTANNPEIERLLPLWHQALRALLYSGAGDNENDAPSDIFASIEDTILEEPAGSWSDIRAKAEILYRGGGAPAHEKSLAFLREIALMDGQPSRVFDPVTWLEWFERLDGCWFERDGEIILLAPVEGRAKAPLVELDACNAGELVRDFIRKRAEGA